MVVGPRGGVVTTATLRDATGWDDLVRDLGLPGLVRHGLRHTALTWMADAGVDLHMLQRVAGHQDPAVTAGYLHPDTQAVWPPAAPSPSGGPELVPRVHPFRWLRTNPQGAPKRALTCRNRSGPLTVGLTGFEPATP